MKKILFIIFIFQISIVNCQQNICKVNNFNPLDFVKKTNKFRERKEFDSLLVSINSEILNNDTLDWHNYQYSCYFSLINKCNKSVEYLNKVIEKVDPEIILSDSDFENLKKSEYWENIKSICNKKYLDNDSIIKNKELSLKIWYLYIEDQKTRTLNRNFKVILFSNASEEKKRCLLILKENKIKINSFIDSLSKKGKWPKISDIGLNSSERLTLILQHRNNKRITKKALKQIEKLCLINESNGNSYALVLDRYLMSINKKQIYGTQLIRYKPKGSKEMSELQLWPIKNEKEVNHRRKSLNMIPIEDYLMSFGLKYEYHPDNENNKIPYRN